MKLAALEMVHVLYPEWHWLKIQTDGSLTVKNGTAGAQTYWKLFSFYLSLEQFANHFGGEIEAMNTALIELYGRNGSFEKAIIFTDSI